MIGSVDEACIVRSGFGATVLAISTSVAIKRAVRRTLDTKPTYVLLFNSRLFNIAKYCKIAKYLRNVEKGVGDCRFQSIIVRNNVEKTCDEIPCPFFRR